MALSNTQATHSGCCHTKARFLTILGSCDGCADCGAAGAELIMKITLSPGDDLAMPIRSMKYVQGSRGQFEDSVLCLGGQSLDEPDSLNLVSLANINNVSEASRSLP